MELLRDILLRLLMLALFVILFAGFRYGVDIFRQGSVSLTEWQNTVDLRQSVCRRLHNEIQKNYAELAAIPFYRVDLRAVKNAEIRSGEVLYHKALQEYHAARESLEKARAGAEGRFLTWERHFFPALLTGIAALFLLPLLLKLVMYFLVARLADRLPPVCLKGESAGSPPGFTPGSTALEVAVQPGCPLFLRSGDWGKRRTGVTARTRFMWSWQYPLVTLAAGLSELVEFSAESGKRSLVTVTSPEPDIFIAKIDLNGGSVVIRPRFLVGVAGDVQIRTRWSFHWHNLLSFRIRQILLSGTGFILVAGAWGVDAARPEAGQDWRIEDDLLLGYSADAEYSLCRTETFWHYFRGKTSLFDQRMQKGIFFTRHNRAGSPGKSGNFLERTANALLNAVGGLLGF
ncbi:MAG: AIM24 family protein [Lentisphaeria bacterium]|nr:AIM24 family protein [Lentisphaeria bacterium]